MPKAKPATNRPSAPARLLRPRDEARTKIRDQREIGGALAAANVPLRTTDPAAFEHDLETWIDVTGHVLRTLFDSEEEFDRFSQSVRFSFSSRRDPGTRIRESREDAAEYVRRLDSLLQRLDLIEELGTSSQAGVKAAATIAALNSVFIVHGHDVAAKQESARLVEQLGLKAVILDEQTNKGRTVIEKFEDHAQECAFAVVLLTPDDLGRSRLAEVESPRARQNVIFELGYFVAKLGRGRVCALHKGQLELPSDIQGVIWVSVDTGSWKLALAKEMRDAGLSVDLNRL